MNLVKGVFLVITLAFFSTSSLLSQDQTKKDLASAFHKADILLNDDHDYKKAAVMFDSLLKISPDNANLAARLGICYLNIEGKNREALALIKRASENVVENEKDYVLTGDKAALDTYLYLAIAYHVNDSLEKALNSYLDAREILANSDTSREEYIDNQIRNCRYAIEMKKKDAAGQAAVKNIWTVQITAIKGNVDKTIFKQFKNVRVLKGDDGFNRYYTGEFSDLSKAKEVLSEVRKAGYDDAFIKELNTLNIK